MNFDPNDPRWSTLILDPDALSADERRELTAFAETNAECGRFLGELRAAAGELEVGLRKELVTPTQWQEMEAAVKAEVGNRQVEKPVKIAADQSSRRRWLAAIAALLLVGVTIGGIYAVRSVNHAAGPIAATPRPLSKIKNAPQATAPADPYYMYDDIDYVAPGAEFKLNAEAAGQKSEVRELIANHGAAAEGVQGVREKVDRLTTNLSDLEAPTEITNAADANLAKTTKRSRPTNDTSSAAEAEYAQQKALLGVAGAKPTGSPPPPPAGVKHLETYSSKGRPAVQFSEDHLREAEENTRYVKPHVILTDGERREDELRYSRGLNRNWSFEQSQGNTEVYPTLVENLFIKAAGQDALSTFSIDVDTASYANVRRFLTQNMLPPAGAVRVEELINYFRYDYAPPTGEHPFAVHVETAACPWEPKHRLARIALKGKVIDEDKRPASNLVFLLDVSGSMNEPNKLPLVKQSLRMLVERLTENDRVAIAVYAGASGLALDSTTGDKKDLILGAIDSLTPGGSTNGEAGIKLAYQQAAKGFIKGGTNRVILCTDGDFNVGVSDDTELVNIITEQAKSGVFLSVLGFGMGNYKDAKMMQLSDKGNGNYAYIDTAREGRKVLVEQMSGTLITIAKDVKIQIEFNPQKVAAYRLIGYEKRMLKTEDFKDDTKDAGEIGAGHTVTALYELVPVGGAVDPAVDPLIFQPNKNVPAAEQPAGPKDERSFVVKLRYKKPDGDTSTEFRTDCKDEGKAFSAATKDFQFASAVASFGMLLRNSEFKGGGNLAAVAEIAAATKGADEGGYRAEFVDLVNAARRIQPGK